MKPDRQTEGLQTFGLRFAGKETSGLAAQESGVKFSRILTD
jgi:hypothetical protein